jgi:1-acyl-sn-glycerol-3-phosphate acyltransferase
MFAVPVSLLFFPFAKHKKIFSKLLSSYMRWTIHYEMPFLRIFEIKELKGIDKIGNTGIIVSNHQSFLDGFLVMGHASSVPLVKSTYKFNPIFAWIALFFEFIALEPGIIGVSKADREIRKRLKNNELLYICPEGTRSLDGKIRKFNTLAFKIAKDMQIPIFPLCIHYSKPIMSKSRKSFLGSEKVEGRIRVLDKILPAENESTMELLNRVQKAVEKSYQELSESLLLPKYL